MKLGREKEETVIPTASMADIAFLLIVFFMVTTVFSATKGLDFKLPKEEEDQQLETETIEAAFVKVFPGGAVLVDRLRRPETGPETDRHAGAEYRRADTPGGRHLRLDLRLQPVRLTAIAHGCQ